MTVPSTETVTSQLILDAARTRLLADGLRRAVDQEGGPGGGRAAVASCTTTSAPRAAWCWPCSTPRTERRLARQAAMYAEDAPLWRRYEQACDFLEDDLESGYVRVLQEMIAAGWSNPEIGAATREMLAGWYELLNEVATEAAVTFGGLGPFSPAEAAALIMNAFIGAEALLLLGFDRHQMPIRASLRRIGDLIRAAEERSAGDRPRGNGGEG